MASSVDLGSELEAYVDRLVRDGRFVSRDDALRAGIGLIRERDADQAWIDEAIREGQADLDAGRTIDAEIAFDRLAERYRPH